MPTTEIATETKKAIDRGQWLRALVAIFVDRLKLEDPEKSVVEKRVLGEESQDFSISRQRQAQIWTAFLMKLHDYLGDDPKEVHRLREELQVLRRALHDLRTTMAELSGVTVSNRMVLSDGVKTPVRRIPVAVAGLPARVVNRAAKLGVKYVDEFSKVTLADLMATGGIGIGTIHDLRWKLNTFGVTLQETL